MKPILLFRLTRLHRFYLLAEFNMFLTALPHLLTDDLFFAPPL